MVVGSFVIFKLATAEDTCEVQYKALECSWDTLLKDPSESKKSFFEINLKTANSECPVKVDKRLLNTENVQKLVILEFKECKKKALSIFINESIAEPEKISLLQSLEKAMALMRLFGTRIEARSALHLLYEDLDSHVRRNYKSLLKEPSDHTGEVLKRQWTSAKKLLGVIFIEGETPEIYTFESLAEYISRDIPSFLEDIDTDDNKKKLDVQLAALKYINPNNRYVNLLNSTESLSHACEYAKKMKQLEDT